MPLGSSTNRFNTGMQFSINKESINMLGVMFSKSRSRDTILRSKNLSYCYSHT